MSYEKEKLKLLEIIDTFERNTTEVTQWHLDNKPNPIVETFNLWTGYGDINRPMIISVSLTMLVLRIEWLKSITDQLESIEIKTQETDNIIRTSIIDALNEFCDLVRCSKYPYAIKHFDVI